MHAKLALTLVLVTIALSGASAQTTVYNNFGPGYTYDMDFGWQQSGPSSIAGTSSVGIIFSPSASGQLFDFTLALGSAGGTNEANFFLREASSVPGTLTHPILENWTIKNLAPYATGGGIKTLTSVANPFLDASKSYIFYGQETGDQYNGWMWNNQSVNGYIFSTDNTTYQSSIQTTPTLEVRSSVTVTPELPGGVLLLPALLPVALVARRKRKGSVLSSGR